ncbi:CorA family divalent cation transporter [Flavobacterium sp. CS20]|jgi:magnesium transporter|uniref:CorA family divalent cation transporter n=1 Tax=Flavobacterium sp. CS20 TaxID=2775246 RepID=UPI001B3A3588|nr:CorA family divalent cation transporter [Flavobacterium sp. CS20]QTY27765.1 hypothetical protein IGB25_04370 [Flavobacterium sp. CS20]
MKLNSKTYKNFTWYDCLQANFKDLKQLNTPIQIPDNFIEDSLEVGHLPKYEKNEDIELIILRVSTDIKNPDILSVGQLSTKIAFIIQDKNLISIHRKKINFLSQVNKEFNSTGAFLFYMIEHIIDSFEKPLNNYSKAIDKMERFVLLDNTEEFSIEKIYFIKSKARMHKKILQMNQNVINQLAINNTGFNSELQDIKDSMLNLLHTADEIIEDTQALLNSYLSITAQKNNDVMKLLTVFSVFFLPLTFIAGIYGMNFKFMPELEYKNAYFIVLGIMVLICIAIYIWFKRNKIL